MTLEELIKERRKDIQDSASCEGCGATLASCKANRGKDPTAPPWFGCCARTLAMLPCRHVPDHRALVNLLKEIESGRVRGMDEVLLDSLTEFPTSRFRIGALSDFEAVGGWEL